jgi:hypothetical protein
MVQVLEKELVYCAGIYVMLGRFDSQQPKTACKGCKAASRGSHTDI